MPHRTCVIVNPIAGGGRVQRLWPKLRPRLLEAVDPAAIRWTSGPNTATELTRNALNEGFDRIAAVGGDGTLHEVVNGFFDEGTAINPSAVLVPFGFGTGTDFCRALDVPIGLASVAQVQSRRVRPIDLLHVRYTTEHGDRAHRYAVNVTSFGLSGTVVRSLPARTSVFGRVVRYLKALLIALLSHQPQSLSLTLDDTPLGSSSLHLVAVGNSSTFGSGIRIAPHAKIDDGQFDVTVIKDRSIFGLLPHLLRFYRGTHPTLQGITTHRGRHLTAYSNSNDPVWLEADGEKLGRLPATIEIVPDALRLQY